MQRQQPLLQLPKPLELIGLGALPAGHVDLLQIPVAEQVGELLVGEEGRPLLDGLPVGSAGPLGLASVAVVAAPAGAGFVTAASGPGAAARAAAGPIPGSRPINARAPRPPRTDQPRPSRGAGGTGVGPDPLGGTAVEAAVGENGKGEWQQGW